MATKKQHRDFPRISPEELILPKKFYLSDLELELLTNFLIYQEFQVILTINNLQKFTRNSRNNFRIPYDRIEQLTGIKRLLTKRHLSNLKEKGILVMTSPMNWSWNIPSIAKLLGPVVEELKPVSRTETLSSERVIFINNPLEDPILKSLPKDWDKI
jgi:hypothetical protein